MIRIFLLCMAIFPLAGCFALTSSKVPVAIYALHAAGPEEHSYNVSDAAIVVAVPAPELPAGFETDKIALYLDNGRRLDYYSDARWAETLDDVIQDIIAESGRRTMPGVVFDSGDIRLPAQYKLMASLTEFSPVYQSGPEQLPKLKVAMTFTLIKLPENRVLTRFTKRREKMPVANTLTDVTAGLENLLQAVLTESFTTIAPLVSPTAKRI